MEETVAGALRVTSSSCNRAAPRWTPSGSTATNRDQEQDRFGGVCRSGRESLTQLTSGPLAERGSPFVVSSAIAV